MAEMDRVVRVVITLAIPRIASANHNPLCPVT